MKRKELSELYAVTSGINDFPWKVVRTPRGQYARIEEGSGHIVATGLDPDCADIIVALVNASHALLKAAQSKRGIKL